jgi:hypothetical protein
MIKDVQFDEPDLVSITPRTFIQREPGVLSDKLMRWGVVHNVSQAKVLISVVVVGGFLTSTYFLEAALSGPDIPPRPPSPLYAEYMAEQQRR